MLATSVESTALRGADQSQNKSMIAHVKSFVGIAGPHAHTFDVDIEHRMEAVPPECWEGSFFRVIHFGTTPSTLKPGDLDGVRGLVKGRAFLLERAPVLGARDRLEPRAMLESMLLHLDGKFSACIAVGESVLLCGTDILGAGSIFYCWSGNDFYFGTHLGLLLQALPSVPEYDQVGVAGFLSSRALLDGRSLYEGISRLTSCSYLAIKPRSDGHVKVSCSRYSSLPDLLADDAIGQANAVQPSMLGELLSESLRREPLSAKCGLMLSGGRDSRAIGLLLAREPNRLVQAVSYGSPGSHDVLAASELARKLRMPHHLVPYGHWDCSTYADRIVALNGGASGLQTNHILVGYDMASTRFDLACVGFLGDAATGAHLPRGHNVGFSDVLGTLLQRRAFVEEYYRDELQYIEKQLQDSFKSMSALPAYQRHLCLDYCNRQASFISLSFDLGESFVTLSYPFFYRPLLRFLFNLPFEALQRQRLYDAWLGSEQSARKAISRRPGPVFRRIERFAVGKLTRLLGRAHDPQRLVDWEGIRQKSAKWLLQRTEDCCDDERLRAVCTASLNAPAQQEMPTIMLALAPCMARCFALGCRGAIHEGAAGS